jgi:maleamate amidohydrolase
MTDDFEDHCWMDIVPPDVLEVYSMYRRKTFVGPAPALLAIDLYEVVYAGGAQPPAKLAKGHPNSCGEYAHAAIEPTKLLFVGARAAGLPVFYSTGDTRAASRPGFITATKRNRPPINPSDFRQSYQSGGRLAPGSLSNATRRPTSERVHSDQ